MHVVEFAANGAARLLPSKEQLRRKVTTPIKKPLEALWPAFVYYGISYYIPAYWLVRSNVIRRGVVPARLCGRRQQRPRQAIDRVDQAAQTWGMENNFFSSAGNTAGLNR